MRIPLADFRAFLPPRSREPSTQQRAGLAWALLGAAVVVLTAAITVYIAGLLEERSSSYLARLAAVYGIIYIPLGLYLYSRLERWVLQLELRERPLYLLHFSFAALLLAGLCLLRVLLAAEAFEVSGRTFFAYNSGWAAFPHPFPLVDLPTLAMLAVFRMGTLLLSGEFQVGAFLACESNRRLLLLLFVWWLGLYLYAVLVHQGDFTPYTNRKTLDFREYKSISNNLVAWNLHKGFYQIGYPYFMAPFNLFSGAFAYGPYSLKGMNLVNWTLLVVVPFGVMGIVLLLLTAGLLEGTGAWKKWRALWLYGLTFPALMLAYGWFRPDYLREGHRWGNTDIGVGFIGGVEPFNALLIALAIYVLARPQRYSAWIGVVGGWAVMTKESNAVVFALFLLMWFLTDEGRRHAVKTGLVAVAVFCLQLAYNYYVFGGGILRHREYQQRMVGRRKRRAFRKEHGFDPPRKPRMGLDYLRKNLPEILGHYWVALLVVTACYVVVMVAHRKRWPLWTFCYTCYVVLLLFYSAWARLGATFRYLHVMAPLGAALVGPALLIGIEKGEARLRELRGRA